MPVMAFLKGGDIQTVMTGLPWEYMIAEGPVVVKFVRRGGPGCPWTGCERGVFFGPDCEVQWRRRADGEIHFVLAGELEPLQPWQGVIELKLWKRVASPVILWGEHDARTGGWFEARIPVALPYAGLGAGEGRRLAIQTRRYRLPDGSEVRRYVDLEVVK